MLKSLVNRKITRLTRNFMILIRIFSVFAMLVKVEYEKNASIYLSDS